MDLQNKGVLVTGGASGLGAACVRLFNASGAKVIVADLNEELGLQLANELGENVKFVKTDVVSEESATATVKATVEAFGGIYIAINCAGIGSAERTVGKDAPHPLNSFNKVIQINLVGTFNIIFEII